MSATVTFDQAKLNSILDGIEGEIDEAVRPAAQAGAQVFYDQVKRNVPRSAKGHYFHGTQFRKNGTKYYFEAGSLQRAIYQVFNKESATDKHAKYYVSWNFKKAPYGFMVEFGTSKAPAHPFLNPAWDLRGEAADAMERKLLSQVKL